MDIFIRNLATSVTENDLRELFEHYDKISGVSMAKKHDSSAPLGFAFITMPAKCQAISAINALKGIELKGKGIEFSDFGLRFERHIESERHGHSRPDLERRSLNTNKH